MFATEWGSTKKDSTRNHSEIKFAKHSSMVWAEHCIECAAPLCYKKCLKYRRRIDGKCRLFKDGINKIKMNKWFEYSARISFEGWSKLEATYRPRQHFQFTINLIEFLSNLFFKLQIFLSKIFFRGKQWYLTNFAYKVREGLSALVGKFGKFPDAFAIQIYNEGTPVSLFLETKDINNNFYFKRNLYLKSGFNEFYIPFNEIKISSNDKSFVFLTPSRDCSLIFECLDFVTFKKRFKKEENEKKESDKKIKCVVWDLDNTLWNGILSEEEVKINENLKKIIIELDKKGIVNSIISKNTYQEAIKKLKDFQIDDYFVFPQINWLPKSINMKRLLGLLNINSDTICFIDDNPFELEEVKSLFPSILCSNPEDILDLLKNPRFDVPITEETKKRRLTYKSKEIELDEFDTWTGNIDDFVKNCHIIANVFRPSFKDLERCFELIQRSNQLNISGRKFSRNELEAFYNDERYELYAISCSDKFGSYGIISFALFDNRINTLTDFVISCRIANKTIEQTFLNYLAKIHTPFYVNFVKTERNMPMFNVLQSMKPIAENNNESVMYKLSYDSKSWDNITLNIRKK